MLAPACATKTISFSSTDKAKVTLVGIDNLDGEGKAVGETPVSIPLSDVQQKVVRLSAPGKQNFFVVLPDAAADETKIAVKLRDDGTAKLANGEPKIDPKATMNRVMRLVLRSYQALIEQRWDEATELATKASAIDPELAGPIVLKGLALRQAGKAADAKTAFTQAKALDPEDTDIDKLVEASGLKVE